MGSKTEVNSKTEPPAKVSKPYGKIVLTLQNCLLPPEKLLQTPSQSDGLDTEIEIDLRILGCELIQSAGILLKLPQVAMATGQVLFQRFYYSKSFVRHSMETTAMACICLASKIEEAPRRIRDVINVIHHLKQLKDEKPITPLILDQYYINLKNQVIKAERRVLKELGFCVHVKHPHKLIVMFLQVLNSQNNSKLMQIAWNYMNDSLRTDVFVRYQPETVACACIYLTARILNIPLPKNPDWFSIFKVQKEDIHSVCYAVLNLYSRPKPDPEALNSAVDKLRKHYQDERSKARGTISGNNSPTVVSPDSPHKDKQTGGSHNAWGGFISRSGSHTVPTEKHRKSKSASPVRNSKKSRRRQSHSNSRSRSRSRSPLSRSRTPIEKYKNRSPSSYKRRSSSPYASPKNTKKIRNKSKYRSRSRSSEWKMNNESKSHKSHNSTQKRGDRYRDQNDEESTEKHVREERHQRYADYDKYTKSNEKHEKYHDRHGIRHSEKSAEKHTENSHRSRGSGKYHRSDRDRSRDRRR